MARIMIVEDDPILSKVLSDCLELIGHEPDISCSVTSFTEKIQQAESWDLIITDFCLDTHTCEMVVELALESRIPVMVFTGHDIEEIRSLIPSHVPTFCKVESSHVRSMEKIIAESLTSQHGVA
ncbi:response regulator [Pseudobacteriovorax antillogorgiicola]|uniref:Response regulator receiver domain-containing protein n=1 Tax=Pseudobacteriovorax antillogorgiicola TaxID=1513793 RepID=A0A1Y6CGZ9_9BACT|nr:response regulator [Pseudobacteriovorax antillogorgiicola]TCS49037.1 response regulator receiver domain-containing protein [Pseudobacteriovorax antillogorgiicola]SMF52681.1 Response regulator receiver domain-containing protein [Pseudobacteriovorax antillogorgiicola]